MNISDIKVDRCPFCGGKSRVHKYFSKYYARCNKCNSYSAPYDTPEEAAAAWNKRAYTLGVDIAQSPKKKLYLCDTTKRSLCNNSSWCFKNGGECMATQYEEYAMIDENGKPIEYTEEGE